MKVNRSCRRNLPCLYRCQNWKNNKSLNEVIKDDYKYAKKFEKHFDVNMNVLVVLSVFIISCFVVYMIFNIKN